MQKVLLPFVVLLMLAGCAPASTSPPAGISVDVYQTRFDGPLRQLQVEVSNNSTEPLTVLGLRFESTRFVEAASFDRSQLVPAGSARDLPVRLAAAVCDGSTPQDLVYLDYELVDGRKGIAVSTVANKEILDFITADDCLGAAVADIVTISPPTGALWEPGAHTPATLEIGLAPTGATGQVTVETIGTTTLFAPVDDSGAQLTAARFDLAIDADSAAASIRLRMVPGRCDPHAVAEDKKGTILPIAVTVTGGPSGTLAIPVSDEVKASLYAFVTDWCATTP